jgi:hypothetical protein
MISGDWYQLFPQVVQRTVRPCAPMAAWLTEYFVAQAGHSMIIGTRQLESIDYKNMDRFSETS